ncbi:hypothetical protein [Bdellovibrio sp. HCB337]|uniref:hypothetical protein n=1 Tax=Bdellovibrio sp. HCB337 TaxID=3394358 RepID=UPI0039A55F95
MADISEVYQILGVDPQRANELALEGLQEAKDQNQKDSLNWVRAYALVEMKEFAEARLIWSDIFIRDGSHKALHQVGFVVRSEGNLKKALELFKEETLLIDKSDVVAVAANLYELCYCSFLLGDLEGAWEYFKEYQSLEFNEVDIIERACFFRLKGDLLSKSDAFSARAAYQKSRELFIKAGDVTGAAEVDQRIAEALS